MEHLSSFIAVSQRTLTLGDIYSDNSAMKVYDGVAMS